MSLNYRNLDDRTRSFMTAEVDSDAARNAVYISPRLNSAGVTEWPSLLRDAVSSHTDAWLAREIQVRGLLKDQEERRNRSGGTTMVRVPVNAHETLSEGEFNRFYVRGICLRAIADSIPHVIAYRARQSEHPRPESEQFIGRAFDPEALLRDLRLSVGVETALGVPPGPNSGLSVEIV